MIYVGSCQASCDANVTLATDNGTRRENFGNEQERLDNFGARLRITSLHAPSDLPLSFVIDSEACPT